ncbi:MAG: hypothetical protein P8X46_11960, partial [Nitrospirales bacterium]
LYFSSYLFCISPFWSKHLTSEWANRLQLLTPPNSTWNDPDLHIYSLNTKQVFFFTSLKGT